MFNETENQNTIDIIADESVVIEDHDGALVNAMTGEIIGYAGAPFTLPDGPSDLTPQEIDALRREAVLWATERRARAEATMKAKTFERDTLIAGVQERFEGQINEQKRRIEWIDATYGNAMKEFATEQLIGAKSKSVKLPWATLGFRASKGAVEVTDPGTAAYTLIGEEAYGAVRLTIDLGALCDEADKDPDGYASLLLDAIGDSWCVKYTEEGLAKNKAIVEKAALPVGVNVSIMAGQLPDVLPDSLIGVSRKAPESPLGTFYVKHS